MPFASLVGESEAEALELHRPRRRTGTWPRSWAWGFRGPRKSWRMGRRNWIGNCRVCRGGHGDSEGIGASCGGGIRSRSRFPGGEVQFHYDDGVSATWSKAKGAFNVRTLIEVRSELGWFGWRRRQRTECTCTETIWWGKFSRTLLMCDSALLSYCLVRLRSFRFYLATFCRVTRVVREFDLQMLKGYIHTGVDTVL